ncbi:MAG: DUF72 domain-containing protein [Pseudomonadota bacterium]
MERQSGANEPARVWVGTSGYSYTGWVTAGFYPPDAKPGQLLSFYAKRFALTELVQTWHQTPQASALELQRRQVPAGFLFCAKLCRSLTHEAPTDLWREQAAAFRHGLAPLVQARQLAAVLIELPSWFDRSVANRRRLAELLDELEGLPLAVEFRQGSWNTDRVFAELERRGVTLAALDAPDLPGLFPPLEVVTNPELFYVRFHGRNSRGWREEKKSAQFDYSYGENELRDWMEKRIVKLAGRTRQGIIVFNNHVHGQAPQNALVMARLLKEYGFVLGKC